MTGNVLDAYNRPDRHRGRLRAVIYIPTADYTEAAARCMTYVRQHHYYFVGVVSGDWAAIGRMFDEGAADVLVADRREHLPADFTPRYEFVAEQPAPTVARRRTARVRIIRPGAAT